jgi:cold shock CspA family protein
MTGTIKTVKNDKGFGFILAEGHERSVSGRSDGRVEHGGERGPRRGQADWIDVSGDSGSRCKYRSERKNASDAQRQTVIMARAAGEPPDDRDG